MAVFKPTGTSKLLIESVRPYIKGGKLLDLGCGCGIVGESLFKDGLDVSASDIDPEARTNWDLSLAIHFRCGSLFEPWMGVKFNYIVDDVSGVAQDIAKASPWFKGVPCESGEDGADLVCEVIRQAPKYLEPNGVLFFPIVSLSNEQRIIETALHTFKNLKQIGHQDFPLPTELKDYPIKKEYIKEKFGMKLFWTDIYMVINA